MNVASVSVVNCLFKVENWVKITVRSLFQRKANYKLFFPEFLMQSMRMTFIYFYILMIFLFLLLFIFFCPRATDPISQIDISATRHHPKRTCWPWKSFTTWILYTQRVCSIWMCIANYDWMKQLLSINIIVCWLPLWIVNNFINAVCFISARTQNLTSLKYLGQSQSEPTKLHRKRKSHADACAQGQWRWNVKITWKQLAFFFSEYFGCFYFANV